MRIVYVVCILIALLLVADFACSTPVYKSGTVVQKTHTASGLTTGVGLVGNKTGVVTTMTPEEWVLVLECEGTVFAKQVSSDLWAKIEEGETVSVVRHNGYLMSYSMEVESE